MTASPSKDLLRGTALSQAAPPDRQAAGAYIAHLSGDLAAIARRHGFDTLGYLLDMARLEAENMAGEVESGELNAD